MFGTSLRSCQCRCTLRTTSYVQRYINGLTTIALSEGHSENQVKISLSSPTLAQLSFRKRHVAVRLSSDRKQNACDHRSPCLPSRVSMSYVRAIQARDSLRPWQSQSWLDDILDVRKSLRVSSRPPLPTDDGRVMTELTGIKDKGTSFSYRFHASPYFLRHLSMSLLVRCMIMSMKKIG